MTTVEEKPRARFAALDELRAIAVFAMISAHFAPGLIKKMPALDAMGDVLAVIGRLATVAFVICFGLTLGFIQFPRYVSGKRNQVVVWLFDRARLVAVCAVLISVPAYIDLWLNGHPDPFDAFLFATYSVLNFYVLAMLSAPIWLWMLRRDTAMRATLLATVHWLTFELLRQTWAPETSNTYLEYLRLQVLSGGYAYLPLAGTSLLAIPIGIWIRNRRCGESFLPNLGLLFAVGAAFAAFGLAVGAATDMTVQGLVDGSVKGPARLWYWTLFGGATLMLLAALAAAHEVLTGLSTRTWLVALFGQSALGIFTTHAWVLPIVHALDLRFAITGAGRAALSFTIFASFCAVTMTYYYRKNKRLAPARGMTFAPATG